MPYFWGNYWYNQINAANQAQEEVATHRVRSYLYQRNKWIFLKRIFLLMSTSFYCLVVYTTWSLPFKRFRKRVAIIQCELGELRPICQTVHHYWHNGKLWRPRWLTDMGTDMVRVNRILIMKFIAYSQVIFYSLWLRARWVWLIKKIHSHRRRKRFIFQRM